MHRAVCRQAPERRQDARDLAAWNREVADVHPQRADGKSSTLKTVVTTDGKIQEPRFELSRPAGFYFTLTNAGPREEQVGVMLRDVQDSWNGYYNYDGWADNAKVDVSAPGQYTLRVSGELAAGDAGVIPFESGTITFERLKDGATTFKELAATAKAALPAGTKLDNLKDYLSAPLIVENADGTGQDSRV
ncbi:MAG: hypothetical protein K8U57_19085 [Planctomycetes bacterium]|nr:hypothetical protein [Planctomycetota bacterium]